MAHGATRSTPAQIDPASKRESMAKPPVSRGVKKRLTNRNEHTQGRSFVDGNARKLLTLFDGCCANAAHESRRMWIAGRTTEEERVAGRISGARKRPRRGLGGLAYYLLKLSEGAGGNSPSPPSMRAVSRVMPAFGLGPTAAHAPYARRTSLMQTAPIGAALSAP